MLGKFDIFWLDSFHYESAKITTQKQLEKNDGRDSQTLFNTRRPVTIECLEEMSVSRPKDPKLRKREQWFIEHNNCVNTRRAYLSEEAKRQYKVDKILRNKKKKLQKQRLDKLDRRRTQRLRRLIERCPTYIT